jgi:hypothetical protein
VPGLSVGTFATFRKLSGVWGGSLSRKHDARGSPSVVSRVFRPAAADPVSSSHCRGTPRPAHRMPHHALNLAIQVRGASGDGGDMTIPAPGLTGYAGEPGRLVTGSVGRGGGSLGSGRMASLNAQTLFTTKGLWDILIRGWIERRLAWGAKL